MTNNLTLGVDFGGSASKATLLNSDGHIVATATVEYTTYFPDNGWSEQNPDEIYEAFLKNIKTIMQNSSISPSDIKAISLDAATHTCILVDEYDRPIRNAIYWTDLRSAEQAQWLKKNHYNTIMEHSYNAPSTAWTLPHLMWVHENEPENFSRICRIYFVKDYIRHRLTGDYVTDSIEAMGALLMNDRSRTWSKELCNLAGISSDILPEIVEPGTIIGFISEKAAKETGLSPHTQVIVGTTDTAMEVFASGAATIGDATVKLATAGRICAVTNGPAAGNSFFNYRHVIPGLWYPGTGTRSCASSYKWYRDVLGLCESDYAVSEKKDVYHILDEGAKATPPGADGLLFHPYLQGEIAPYFDDLLRGSFVGISSFHTRGHFSRAVLEGVAYSLKDCLELTRAHNIKISNARIIGGGAKSLLWSQIVANMFEMSLIQTEVNDSSLGSAMLAGVACGLFSSYEDSIEKCVKIKRIIEPSESDAKIYRRGFDVYKKIQAALSDIYHY